jgi:hypothetical protein
MFPRAKKSGRYEYLQIVENYRDGGRVRQRVLATLGRLDRLQESGELDRLVVALARFAKHTAALSAHERGEVPEAAALRIGPPLVFERLWEELGIGQVLNELLRKRRFLFPVERAVWLTVLHRLFDPGSDRAAEVWRHKYRLAGTEELQLQHLYRAMAWLGEELPPSEQAAATPFAPRVVKDRIEEALFHARSDLFSTLDLCFFDTTSLYFEGQGGIDLGRRGKSKDHRPDLKQMVVGAVLGNDGRPICSELWPGNTTDVKALLPVLERLEHRFGVSRLCIVGDRGLISKDTIEAVQKDHPGVHYILGARMRSVKEVKEDVLSRPGAYKEVHGPRENSKDPSPLKVKNVWVEDRRYVLCYNEEQARKDRADREQILASLEEQLRRGDKSLVGNKGYRKYLKPRRSSFEIDPAKIEEEARFDGKWVLRTDLDWDAGDIALKYRELWTVEAMFRAAKSVLATRPIYHKCDETIRGHVFCSFLALMLLKELQIRMEARGWPLEWDYLRRDLDALQAVLLEVEDRPFVIRTRGQGYAGRAIQAAGVALGPTVRMAEKGEEKLFDRATSAVP